MKKLDFKGAIFDLDGTLLDSMRVWVEVDNEFLSRRGIEPTQDYVDAIAPMGFRRAAEYTIERFNFKETPEEIMEEWYSLAESEYSEEVRLKPNVKAYLKFLKQKNIPMAVATASEERLFIPSLKNNGIYEYFESFTTVNEVKRGKGFPDIYIKAAEKLGLEPSECVVFEDILAGVKGARTGGFKVVGIYDNVSKHEHDEMKMLADICIHDFGELLEEGD